MLAWGVDITVHFAGRAIAAVRAVAATEILPRYRTVAATRKDDGSVVTEADLAAQRALVRELRALEKVPVLGEEMPAAEQRAIAGAGGRYWCVDPIDGTTNFSTGFPFFAVSVALMEGDRPVFGVVHDPIADEAFFAVRGAGAWLNHAPLAVNAREPDLRDAIAEVALRRSQPHLRQALKARPPFRRRKTSGSSALSWCHLAAGRVDLYLHAGQHVWDYAAGALVLQESGGLLSTLAEDDFWSGPYWMRSVVAARTPELFGAWRSWVRENLEAR